MAERRAAIFGTEKDQQNCPFYLKIGACRHGDRCSRLHNKPVVSQTILLPNLYASPISKKAIEANGGVIPNLSDAELQAHFDEFYEDIFEGLAKYGPVDLLNVCANLGDHLIGNVYVKYKREDDANESMKGLKQRFYDGRQIISEFSPVTDFTEARCRQYDIGTCNRGGFCNFMHLHNPSKALSIKLFGERKSRSPSPRRREYREYRDRDRRGGYDREYSSRRGPYDRDGGYRDRDHYRDYRDRDRDYPPRGDSYRDNRDYPAPPRGDSYRDNRDYPAPPRGEYDNRRSYDYDDANRRRSKSPQPDYSSVPPPPSNIDIPASSSSTTATSAAPNTNNSGLDYPEDNHNNIIPTSTSAGGEPPISAPLSAGNEKRKVDDSDENITNQSIQWATSEERRTDDYNITTSLKTSSTNSGPQDIDQP
ncbi:hypothetical protein CYY_008878 [Polysphondylium violaceum]|uniref:RNA-binding region RNP-1 domain-containing protein n=1 Tax=Polysphondylium violaceum TaxID=133409 RepID=A0A8J4UPV8_9MYCE|nr:hypothetical protein CYY_008878 [Polysphondylium violaceum]